MLLQLYLINWAGREKYWGKANNKRYCSGRKLKPPSDQISCRSGNRLPIESELQASHLQQLFCRTWLGWWEEGKVLETPEKCCYSSTCWTTTGRKCSLHALTVPSLLLFWSGVCSPLQLKSQNFLLFIYLIIFYTALLRRAQGGKQPTVKKTLTNKCKIIYIYKQFLKHPIPIIQMATMYTGGYPPWGGRLGHDKIQSERTSIRSPFA